MPKKEKNMKVAYYPGCTLTGTAREFGDSMKEACAAAGLELVEIPGWTCCGATSAHTTDRMLSLALPLHNLIKVEQEMRLGIMTAPCAACHQRSKITHHEYTTDEKTREALDRITGKKYNGTVECRHPLEILMGEHGPAKWKKRLKRGLKGLKTACYYGCLLTRPEEIMDFDSTPEDPQLMDSFCKELGAEPVKWNYKVTCCGASYSASRAEIALKLTNDILKDAKDSGAECIVVACPLCHTNLDLRQKEVEKAHGEKYDMPIIYFTELLGLALGIDEKRLGLHTHSVDAIPFLKKKRLI